MQMLQAQKVVRQVAKRTFYKLQPTCNLYRKAIARQIARKIEDTAKGGLTIAGELFTVIPCAFKDFKRYLKVFRSQILQQGFSNIEEAYL